MKNIRYIIFCFFLIFFFLILGWVLNEKIVAFDTWGYNILSKYVISDNTTILAKFITNFGSIYVILGLVVILMLLLRKKKDKMFVLFNVGFITIFNQVLKLIIGRVRPVENQMIKESGYSFPSGHSMLSVAFYGFLIYLIYQSKLSKKLKIVSISLLSVLIILISLSRVYLGVHYLSDVLGGTLVTMAYLIVLINIYEGVEYEK